MPGKIKFGSFDSIYPNGIVIAGGDKAIFGIRLLTLDAETGELIYGRNNEITVCPNHSADQYSVKWSVNGKNASFSWTKIRRDRVLAKTEFDEGLKVVAELYVPWRSRLRREWINYSRQADRIFAGEFVAPFASVENNAIRVLTDRSCVSCGGYNMKQEEYEILSAQQKIVNVSPRKIWSDLGLWWHYGLLFDGNFQLLIDCGNAKDFLDLPEDAQIDEMFAQAVRQAGRKEKKIFQQAFSGQGIYENICQVMPAAMYYNSLYHYPTGKRYIITDRTWTRNDEDWGILFNWDTFFSSWLSSWFDGDLAQENMLCAYDMQLPDGKIPLHSRAADGYPSEPPITAGRCQHIVHGLTLWNTYLHTKDLAWLKRCYPKAKKVHQWWFARRPDGQRRRDPLDIGLLTFGYDAEQEMGLLGARVQPYAGQAQYAYFETYDDNPQWTHGDFFKSTDGLDQSGTADFTDEAKYEAKTHTVNMYTLERSSLYAIECLCLKNAAQVLGYEEDVKEHQQAYEQICDNINRYMWDEETGCYYNLRFDGTQSRVQTPDCFLPMAAGAADEKKVKRLLQLLTDEGKFWGDYPMPSVAKDHPAYPSQTYWRGAIWPPMIMWTYMALKNAGDAALKWDYAKKVAAMLDREWTEFNRYPENYNSITGLCNGAPHYNWGVLMALPLIEELVDVQLDRIVFGSDFAPVGSGVKGIRLDGKCYDVFVTEHGTEVHCDGKLIACAEGRITLERE